MESNATSGEHLRACGTCGLVQRVPRLAPRERARCMRCKSVVARPRLAHSASWTAALALAALILYPLAVGLPFLTVSRLGHQNAASILESSVDLVARGDLLVGGVVFVCSVLLPIAKLAGLLAISSARTWRHQRHAAWTWRTIELAGRWGMIDVLLAAVLLALLKLGDVLTVTPGPGLFAFTLCVLLSLAASATFDPHALWETE